MQGKVGRGRRQICVGDFGAGFFIGEFKSLLRSWFSSSLIYSLEKQIIHARLIPDRRKKQMASRVQDLAARLNMPYDEFIGEMRKHGCSEPTAAKIWQGIYEHYDDFKDNDVYLSSLRKAAFVLKVSTGGLLPERTGDSPFQNRKLS
jgi:hypothetical protein